MICTFCKVMVLAIFSSSLHAQTLGIGPDEQRIQWEKAGLEHYMLSGEELTARQSLLFSMKVSLSAEELDDYASKYRMNVSSVFLCSGQGTMGVDIPLSETVAKRSQTVELHRLMRAPRKENELAPESESDLAPGSLKFCGFRAKMVRSSLEKLTEDIQSRLISVEVSDGRIRNFPINRRKIYGACPSCS